MNATIVSSSALGLFISFSFNLLFFYFSISLSLFGHLRTKLCCCRLPAVSALVWAKKKLVYGSYKNVESKKTKRNETNEKRNKQNWVKIVRQPEVAVAVSEILQRGPLSSLVFQQMASPSSKLKTQNWKLKCVRTAATHRVLNRMEWNLFLRYMGRVRCGL